MSLSSRSRLFVSMMTTWCLAAAVSQAAITWGSAVTVVGDTDVSTSGTLAYAYRFDASTGVTSNLAINGVTFTSITGSGSTAAPYSHTNFTFAPVQETAPGTMQSTNHQFATGRGTGLTSSPTLTANYISILGGLIFAGGANSTSVTGRQNAFSLTLDNLQIGQSYSVQLWFNDSRSGTGNRQGTIDGGTTVDYNTTNAAGGRGQHVTGTFVATGEEETFTFRGFADENVGAQLNAFQLRIVPEPSSVLLGGIAATVLGFRRKR